MRPRTAKANAEAPALAEPPRLAASDLRLLVRDPEELYKGTRLVDDGMMSRFARHANKLYAEAAGSAASPYRVAIAFHEKDGGVSARPRCTCMAARSRPVCKHAAALFVAWARAPESFVTADAPPAGAPGERKKSVRRGATKTRELMAHGTEQMETLVRELGVTGVASADAQRAAGVRVLGESLREYKLRRLSARALDLADLLDKAVTRKGAPEANAYAELFVDLLLTSRKIARSIGGEPLDDRHVEELVGKTWRKEERAPIEGLDLVEYAYLVSTTSDDFVIRESRLFDVAKGDHYSEKQIVPAMMARFTEPKRSRAGALHAGAQGSLYPGYSPRRIEITDLGDARPIDAAALDALAEHALPDVRAALAALQEHRRDVFAPERFPVAVTVDALVARGDRLQAVDAGGFALHLPVDAELEARLGAILRDARLVVLVGDLGLEAALPTLFPRAVVVKAALEPELHVFAQGEPPKRRGKAPAPRVVSWTEAARDAGASPATIALGEVREELAGALVDGLAAFGHRVADPLAVRLRELGLEAQAKLLDTLVAHPDPFDRVDDFVRLYQVLSTALLRLAAALPVDRASLEAVPTYQSVYVARSDEALAPAEIARRVAGGSLNRYEAAALAARFYAALPEEEWIARADALSADASAAPFVVRALADRPEALDVARRWLAATGARMSKATALRLATRIGGDDARALLAGVARSDDQGLATLARAGLEAIEVARGNDTEVATRRDERANRLSLLLNDLELASSADERAGVMRDLVAVRDLRAAPTFRRIAAADPSRGVREEAVAALALLADPELVDTMLRALAERGDKDLEKDAATAAKVLGVLGDARAAPELVAAFVEGFKPGIVSDALRALGPAAIEPLAAAVAARPELQKRAVVREILGPRART